MSDKPEFNWDIEGFAVIVESTWHKEPLATFHGVHGTEDERGCLWPMVQEAQKYIEELESGARPIPERTRFSWAGASDED